MSDDDNAEGESDASGDDAEDDFMARIAGGERVHMMCARCEVGHRPVANIIAAYCTVLHCTVLCCAVCCVLCCGVACVHAQLVVVVDTRLPSSMPTATISVTCLATRCLTAWSATTMTTTARGSWMSPTCT